MNIEISPITSLNHIDLFTVREVLTSDKISTEDKRLFIERNRSQIKTALQKELTAPELEHIMKYRPLIKYRPIKNSYTKAGDKAILAKALGISPGEIPSYINVTTEAIQKADKLAFLDNTDIEKIKIYIYRHGKKNEVLNFLNHELENSKNKLKILYNTLEYGTGGVADYFERPIHRLDNKTLIQLYETIDKQLSAASKKGEITEREHLETSMWALAKIYGIQNNQKLIRARKTLQKIT